ncbi:hypothetical protein Tco_0420724, partial [Tanacetum coccineum]
GRQRSPAGRKRVKLVSSRVASGGRVVCWEAEVSSGDTLGGRDVLPGGTKDESSHEESGKCVSKGELCDEKCMKSRVAKMDGGRLWASREDDISEAGIAPLWKRARFTTPTGRFEVGESSSVAAARQAGHTLAHIVDYKFIDTMDASIRAAESRAMTTVEDDQALLGAQVSILRRKRRYFCSMASSYEREAIISRHAWSHSESKIHAMEAHIRALQRDVDVLQRQRIRDEDRLTAHIQHEHDRFSDLVHAAEAGPQDGPKDAGSSCLYCIIC